LAALLALLIAYGLGYTGSFSSTVVVLELCLVPAAGICWVLATFTKMGDRWTLAYLSVVAINFVAYLTVPF